MRGKDAGLTRRNQKGSSYMPLNKAAHQPEGSSLRSYDATEALAFSVEI